MPGLTANVNVLAMLCCELPKTWHTDLKTPDFTQLALSYTNIEFQHWKPCMIHLTSHHHHPASYISTQPTSCLWLSHSMYRPAGLHTGIRIWSHCRTGQAPRSCPLL